MNIKLSKLAMRTNKLGQLHFTVKIGDDKVSVSSFSAEMPDSAVGIIVGDVEDHTFKGTNDEDITIKRAKFEGWLIGDRLTKEEEIKLRGEINATLVAKAGEAKYNGALSF